MTNYLEIRKYLITFTLVNGGEIQTIIATEDIDLWTKNIYNKKEVAVLTMDGNFFMIETDFLHSLEHIELVRKN